MVVGVLGFAILVSAKDATNKGPFICRIWDHLSLDVASMIYDCFTFFNELDLLEIRLNILKDVVDKFVIVEATHNHQGETKPLYFQENEKRFHSFQNKIIHVIADNPPPLTNSPQDHLGNTWAIENWQRSQIGNALQGCCDEDVIILSDMDEIPRPEAIVRNIKNPGITTFFVDNYNFFVNFKSSEPPFPVVKMVTYGYYRQHLPNLPFPENQKFRILPQYWQVADPNKLRALPGDHLVPHGGWHFSYLGGLEQILRKRRSIVEQQYNDDETTSAEWVIQRIRQGRDIYRRGYLFYPTNRGLPRYLLSKKQQYPQLFWHAHFLGEAQLLAFRFGLLKLASKALCLLRSASFLRPIYMALKRFIPIFKGRLTH